jgi:uncharacterized protein
VLSLKPSCEHCDVDLPPESETARICTFECTYCATCVDSVLHGVCPNCGGNFSTRPIRPAGLLERYPASNERVHVPVDLAKHQERLASRMASAEGDPRT